MPNLSELTDYEIPAPEPVPANIPRVYVGSPGIEDRKEEKGIVQKVTDRLLGLNGEERYQLWPEKVVREGLSAAGDVAAGKVPQWGVDPATGDVHTSPQMIEKAQAISALAGSGGLAGGAEGSVLNATPSLRPALKYKDKLYKGKPGQEHQDVIPDHLYSEFQDMAMKGEDISHYNFGFVNDKGHFLNREDALKYGIDSGLIDPQAGKFGALTSTLMADSSKPGTAIEAMAKADPFFSALEHNVSKIGQSKMTGDQWLGTLSNKPGVKPEELDWTGLKSFLQENGKASVTKEQIEQHLVSNKVELKEVNKGGNNDPYLHYMRDSQIAHELKTPADIDLAKKHNSNFRETFSGMSDREILKLAREAEATKDVGNTKYHSYQLPGGENYREMLMTLPPTKNTLPQFKVINEHGHVESTWTDKAKADAWAAKNNYQVREDAPVTLNGGYRSSHWDEPNILAHVRMNDRTIDGKKSLHLEEIQSDWHQAGRKAGYKDEKLEKLAEDKLNKAGYPISGEDAWMAKREGILTEAEANAIASQSHIPNAPFKTTWHELALKRMIREAAEKGYDRLSWTPGEAQAARYDLSKSVDKLQYNPTTEKLLGHKGNSLVVDQKVSSDKLADFVGKEAAKKLLNEPTAKIESPNHKGTFNHYLEGQDLKVGGEGMKGFYDSIIPKAIEKLGKEHGVKVKQGNLPSERMSVQPGYKEKSWDVVSQDGTGIKKFDTKAEAEQYVKERGPKLHYIDIPQSLRDTAIGKGFPLFSSTHIFTPVAHDPFNEKKK